MMSFALNSLQRACGLPLGSDVSCRQSKPHSVGRDHDRADAARANRALDPLHEAALPLRADHRHHLPSLPGKAQLVATRGIRHQGLEPDRGERHELLNLSQQDRVGLAQQRRDLEEGLLRLVGGDGRAATIRREKRPRAGGDHGVADARVVPVVPTQGNMYT